MSNITEVANATLGTFFNANGKIPLEVTLVASQNSTQFWLTMIATLISSIFILMFLWNGTIKPIVAKITIKNALQGVKAISKRNILFIKHTQSGLFGGSMITQETMLQLNKALAKFSGKPFDLVLHTPGGEIFSSMFISRIINQYPEEVRVIIPMYAMSGGTLLALSGDSIYMSETGCLGPVDPQLGNLFKYGSAKAWKKIVELKGKKAEDSSISFDMMGQQYTKSISGHINMLLTEKIVDENKRKAFTDFLTGGDVEHAYALSMKDLQAFGLPINKLDKKITEKLNKVISSPLYEGVYHT